MNEYEQRVVEVARILVLWSVMWTFKPSGRIGCKVSRIYNSAQRFDTKLERSI